MTTSAPRLRRHPADRFAGEVSRIELTRALATLRGEAHAARDGHRQIALVRKGPVRVVLYAFEAGGRLEAHHAPGYVIIQALHGTVHIQVGSDRHSLSTGEMLALDPDVVHDVEALDAADVLLTVSLLA